MSQTALEALRRLLGAPLRTSPPARAGPPDRSRVEGGTGAPNPAGAFLADGDRPGDRDDDHLRDVPDGAGCTEIWEHLSEHQGAEATGDD